MTIAINATRARLAQHALQVFVHDAYCERTISDLHPDEVRDAIVDLICDLGHYADRRFQKRTRFTDLVCRGVGMWSAERDAPGGEPKCNHDVRITIHKGGAL
jgi:hypothetical protein